MEQILEVSFDTLQPDDEGMNQLCRQLGHTLHLVGIVTCWKRGSRIRDISRILQVGFYSWEKMDFFLGLGHWLKEKVFNQVVFMMYIYIRILMYIFLRGGEWMDTIFVPIVAINGTRVLKGVA